VNGDSDGNRFPNTNFLKEWIKELPIDNTSFGIGWVIVPKFGNNVDRKKVMDFIQAQTGSVLKPEFRTWT
jgi:hypothetical protein